MKNTLKIIGFCLVILTLTIACDTPYSALSGGDVIVKIAGSDARTIMPVDPVFNRFELSYQSGNNTPVIVEDTTGIDTVGVPLILAQGTWTINLKAYQDILGDGIGVLAAEGSADLTIGTGLGPYVVSIDLLPIPIGSSAEKGLFSFNIILPEGVDTAFLNLIDSEDNPVDGFVSYSLLNGNNEGSIALAPGYYDLSIILTRNGQNAGTFESVHIYSGLESPAVIDLSGIVFADKVYIAGTLQGIRLGTVIIAGDEDGTDVIKTLELKNRNVNWVIDIPAVNIGKTIYAIQEFDGKKSEAVVIANLLANGRTGVALKLVPDTSDGISNINDWYSNLTVSGGTDPEQAVTGDGSWKPGRAEDGTIWLELDFGFDVTVNASRLIFEEATDQGYSISYWENDAWAILVSGNPADEAVSFTDFFETVTAQKFRLEFAPLYGNVPGLAEFGLYLAADRSALISVINAAQANLDNTLVSEDGEDINIFDTWVTPAAIQAYQDAIDAAQSAFDDVFKTDAELAAAKETLDAATGIFNNAKTRGEAGKPQVNGFSVQDGYADKFIINWENNPQIKYVLGMSSDNVSWNEIAVLPATDVTLMASYTVTAAPGVTRYFAIQASIMGILGEEVKSEACLTLGVSVLTLAPGYSYSTITARWTPAQKADAYQIKYKYTDEADWTVTATLEAAAIDELTYTFRPRGYNSTSNSGKELEVAVEALNLSLDGEFTVSNIVSSRLVGPAEMNVQASRAASADSITVSWDSVDGAGGYHVFRRQFDMNNNNATGAEEVQYVSASDAARYTLQDSISAGSDQADDMAQGFPFRYIVVPVINKEDIADNKINYDDNSYTLLENGETIEYTNAVYLEKTGYTVGFGLNVIATKGTYASTGNVNNGIRVTWSVPPLIAGSGYTYTVFRRAYNGEWGQVAVTGNTEHIEAPARGILYEYAVGISNGSAPASRPFDSERFMTTETAREGFMLDMVKMHSVSRGENAADNAVFGERVTWNSGGIAYSGDDKNYGVGGYTVYVMNRNINANWHIAADNVDAPVNTGATQNILLTPSNTPNISFSDGLGAATRNVLFVLRDYKHFFKVRSYVMDGTTKIYSPDPPYTYTSGTATNPHFSETDHVKWGARQITATEFARIATLYIARGIEIQRGNTWTSNLAWSSSSASSNYGGGGTVRNQSNAGVTTRDWEYRNFRTDLQTRAGDWTIFIAVDGNMWMSTTASSWPNRYGRATNNYRENRIWIAGPPDTPLLYNGAVHFGGNGTADLEWSAGVAHVIYPSGTTQQTIPLLGQNSALPFRNNGNYRHSADPWR
ncbi:MAG: hypothetical protein FWD26_07515 [Treponema sp.]|nr:hypothetical protein [Treponema sp.]